MIHDIMDISWIIHPSNEFFSPQIAVLTRAWRMDFGAPSPRGQWWQVPQVPVPRPGELSLRHFLSNLTPIKP